MATCYDWLIVKVPPLRENPTLPESTEAPPGSVCVQAGVIGMSAVEGTSAVIRELLLMTEGSWGPVQLARSCGELCEAIESLRLGDLSRCDLAVTGSGAISPTLIEAEIRVVIQSASTIDFPRVHART